MSNDARRALGFFVGVVAVGAFVVLGVPRLLGAASGPETELITQLKESERSGVALEVPGVPVRLQSHHHQFDRLSVRVDLAQHTGVVTATLDFEGKLGETKVSSLGLERVTFAHDDGSFTPDKGLAPRLCAIVAALERRRQALEGGSRDALTALASGETGALKDPELVELLSMRDRRYRATAWYIRSEREEVMVSEEFRVSGTLPDKPVERTGSRRLSLVSDGGEFFFAAGLM